MEDRVRADRAPVIPLRSEIVAGQSLLLPVGIVSKLNGQRGQGRWFVLKKRDVERDQIPRENSITPAIGNDVMHGEHEQMFQRRESHQSPAEERARPKIERMFRFFPHQMRGKISRADSWEITRAERRQIHEQTRSDQLIELASFAFESRAKRLVPGHDFV